MPESQNRKTQWTKQAINSPQRNLEQPKIEEFNIKELTVDIYIDGVFLKSIRLEELSLDFRFGFFLDGMQVAKDSAYDEIRPIATVRRRRVSSSCRPGEIMFSTTAYTDDGRPAYHLTSYSKE